MSLPQSARGWLTLCMLGNFSCFQCHLLTFSKENLSGNTFRVLNSLELDQDQCCVGPDLGPPVCKGNQQMTKVASNKEKVKCSLEASLDTTNMHAS